jgi:methyl-accepting chemotaxis protein
MADLRSLEQEVAALKKQESNDFNFMDALEHMEKACATTADGEIERLRVILNSFRLKLPNRETLNADRVKAKDLADALMLATLRERIDRINTRNQLLAQLTDELQNQIDKANNDAALLKQIKEGVDKATKTVNEAKALVDTLTATDVSTKDKLKSLIQGLGSISSIFRAQAA